MSKDIAYKLHDRLRGIPPAYESDRINLIRSTIAELEKRIGEQEAERDEALREHTDMMWQRRRAEEEAEAERQRREECEAALDYVEPNLINGSNSWLAVRAYRSRYPSESDKKVAG